MRAPRRYQSAHMASLVMGLSIFLFMLLPVPAYAETYAEGYLRYTVDDGSVTITQYVGYEDEVWVPSTVVGNPVNIIATGSFANAVTVHTVHLPDSVVSIEEGAFSPAQTLVGDYNLNDEIATVSNELNNAGKDVRAKTHEAMPAGIVVGNGAIVTVDNDGKLVYVARDGERRVLDDTQVYTKVLSDEEELIIKDANGGSVGVSDEGIVSYVRADRNMVEMDTAEGREKTISPDGSTSIERVWETANDEKAATEDENLQVVSSDAAKFNGNRPPLVVCLLLLISACAAYAVHFLHRRERKR